MPVPIKQGDTRPLEVTLTANKKPVPLTGSTVRFAMAPKVAGIGSNIEDGEVDMTDADEGKVRYFWQPGETDNVGVHRAEFVVTFSDGVIETFPDGDYLEIEIVGDVEPVLPPPPAPEPTPEALRTPTLVTFEYNYNAGGEPPGNSQVRIDGTDFPLTTKLWAHKSPVDGSDVHTLLMAIRSGALLYVQDYDNHLNFVRYHTTGAAIDKGNYVEYPVVHESGAGVPTQRVLLIVVIG
jgi:BppU N-terminal domain